MRAKAISKYSHLKRAIFVEFFFICFLHFFQFICCNSIQGSILYKVIRRRNFAFSFFFGSISIFCLFLNDKLGTKYFLIHSIFSVLLFFFSSYTLSEMFSGEQKVFYFIELILTFDYCLCNTRTFLICYLSFFLSIL